MAKEKPAPLIHTQRLLALVPFISAHQGISLKELAATFNVSTAQMTSDLTTLWMCGLPGYTALELMDLSFESGYVTIRNAQTLETPRSLNPAEIVSLLMGLDLLKDSLDSNSELQRNIEFLINRLSEKSAIASKLRATSDVSSSLRAELERAIADKSTLSLTYHSLYSDSVAVRSVKPLELRNENGTEYLFAYCHTVSDFRVFRLDRVMEFSVDADMPTQSPAHALGNTEQINFAIKINSRLRLIKERFALDAITAPGIQRSQSFSKQWIMRSVFGSSGSVELIEPADLKVEIGQKAQLMLDRYLAN